MASTDPWSVLGLAQSATEADVKDAFRKAALAWHPDRHVGGGEAAQLRAAERFSEAARAYEFLTDPRRRRGAGGAGGGASDAWRRSAPGGGASGAWRERTARSSAYDFADGPYAWRHTDMSGASTAAQDAGPWTLRRFGRSLGGVAAGGLIMLFLTTASPLELLSRAVTGRGGSAEGREGRSSGNGANSGGNGVSSGAAAPHRPTPERLSHAAAHALGLQYRPPRLAQRSAAQHRWSEAHARSASDSADAAEAAAGRAAAAAAAAADAAARARAAAARAANADAPGEVAAASAVAAAAAQHAARNEAAAEYAAALATVAAGVQGVEPPPDIVYGSRPPSPAAQAAAVARGAAPPRSGGSHFGALRTRDAQQTATSAVQEEEQAANAAPLAHALPRPAAPT